MGNKFIRDNLAESVAIRIKGEEIVGNLISGNEFFKHSIGLKYEPINHDSIFDNTISNVYYESTPFFDARFTDKNTVFNKT